MKNKQLSQNLETIKLNIAKLSRQIISIRTQISNQIKNLLKLDGNDKKIKFKQFHSTNLEISNFSLKKEYNTNDIGHFIDMLDWQFEKWDDNTHRNTKKI